MRDEEILDSYDEQMEPYYTSDGYDFSQKLIDLKYNGLKETLDEDQRGKLLELMNALSEGYARTAMVAYVTGVRHGNQILDD